MTTTQGFPRTFGQVRPVAALLVVATMVTGCSSTTASTSKPRAASTPKTPTAVPSPSAARVAPGPYAVVLTNAPRQGASYDILLIDLQGQIVTRVTAKLPLLKANQTVTLPLVSASNDVVYYLDGDTDIRSLSPSGATALVKTIAAGSGSILTFAVSPDDQRIAVSSINQGPDSGKDTGHGYVEDLADTGGHVDLFSNTGLDALRWPVGWHGTDIVDGVGNTCGGYGGAGGNGCASSYHVIRSTTGARLATVCETPATQSATVSTTVTPNGLPVSGGIVCVRSEYYTGGSPPPEAEVLAVDWSGRVTVFAATDKNNPTSFEQAPYVGCFLAPGGAQMACNDVNSQALTLVAHGVAPHSLGRRYNVLGWADSTHLLVDIDSKTLAILNTSSGAAVNLALVDADKVEMAGAAPGAL